jgi:outer membrane immunogenic protein
MRKLGFLTTTALTTSLVSSAGMAADLRMPVKAPVIAPPFSWSGCYIGGNAGGVSARIEHGFTVPSNPVVTRESTGRDTGFTGGGQVGCNWQYSPSWVFGVEADINYVGVKRSSNFAFSVGNEEVTGTQTTKLRWLTTIRGRLGPTWDRSFLYVTGGAAIGGIKSSITAIDSNNSIYGGSVSNTRFGWTVGGGYEYAFSRTISGKLEYLHFDLGRVNYQVNRLTGVPNIPVPWSARARASGDIIRAGINFRWN